MDGPQLRHRRSVYAGASAELTEPLVAPDDDDQGHDDRQPSSSGHPAPQTDGWPALGDLQQNGAEWAAFVQSLVVNCVEGCRSLLVTIGNCMWPLLPRPGRQIQLTPAQAERLQALQARIQVPYNGDDPAHQDALRRLWAAGFPDEPCTSLRTERWKDMGWQGEDPGTDFRGGGYLALQCHLYMAAHQPDLFAALRWKRTGQRSDWEYPFAVAGVNVTFMLVESLDLRTLGRTPATPAGIGFLRLLEDSDVAFEEIYCAAFELLDRHWLELRATYMEFPIALRKTKDAIERVLSIGVQSVEELRKLLAMETL